MGGAGRGGTVGQGELVAEVEGLGTWGTGAAGGGSSGAWGCRGGTVLTPSPGAVGEPGSVPHIAFSAALSTQRAEPGTVPFDQVLLNDGGAYDPETGECRPRAWLCVGMGGDGGCAVGWGAVGTGETWAWGAMKGGGVLRGTAMALG